MIYFDLREAHSEYRDLIVETYEGLVRKYPMADLREVVVYPAERAYNTIHSINHSLGDATQPYKIRLNGYWFSQPLSVLKAAGEVDDYMPGFPNLRWHGGLPQPKQVLNHEFFHILSDSMGQEIGAFSQMMWLETIVNPQLAPTGYACFDNDEWFAEAGAMHALGNPSGNAQVEELGRFLQSKML